MKTRHSRQREAIHQALCGRRDHPTAEALHQALKADWPGLSLGTVYRNLARLSETGRALRLPREGADRFDGNLEPHCHITCEGCGAVFDLPCPDWDALDRQAAAGFAGEITGHSLWFAGVCAHCLRARQNGAELPTEADPGASE